jgi:hypothetical protein
MGKQDEEIELTPRRIFTKAGTAPQCVRQRHPVHGCLWAMQNLELKLLAYWITVTCVMLLLPTSCSRTADENLFSTPLTKEADEFLTNCNLEFNAKQTAFYNRWLVDEERYDVDLEKGVFRLTRRAKPLVFFDVQVLGSHSRKDNSWEWAWNNPNVSPRLARASAQLKDVGTKYGLRYLQVGFVPVPIKEFPLYVGGIAMKVSGFIGLYRAEYGELDIYLLLNNPREQLS